MGTVEGMVADERILVTGASGFLGAWIVRDLLERGVECVLFDRDPSLRRLDDLIPNRPELTVETGDIADADLLTEVAERRGVTRILHLAALQIPSCRPNPMNGARVNVLGTLAVFEAARRLERVRKVVYASSAAVIGPEEFYGKRTVTDRDALAPATHYGVFKQCNEGAAQVYFRDEGVPSIGLRPWTVYGLGRDQGLTSDATQAIAAAIEGRRFTIRYSGRNALQYAGDVAAAFVLSTLDDRAVCRTFNLRGEVVEMDAFVALIEAVIPGAKGLIEVSGDPIPVACDLDDSEYRSFLPDAPSTSLEEGIRRTVDDLRRVQG